MACILNMLGQAPAGSHKRMLFLTRRQGKPHEKLSQKRSRPRRRGLVRLTAGAGAQCCARLGQQFPQVGQAAAATPRHRRCRRHRRRRRPGATTAAATTAAAPSTPAAAATAWHIQYDKVNA